MTVAPRIESDTPTCASKSAAAHKVEGAIVLLDLHLREQQLGVPMIRLMAMGAKVVLVTASRDPRLIATILRARAGTVIDIQPGR